MIKHLYNIPRTFARSARTKLRDERGVSLVVVLIALIVCLGIGAAILAAAQMNAGRYAATNTEESQEQAYRTVSSAASVLKEAIVGDSISYTITGSTTKRDGEMTERIWDVSSMSSPTYAEATGHADNPLANMIGTWVNASANNEEYTLTKECTINASVGTGSDSKTLDPVTARITIYKGRILVKLSLGEHAEPNYVMNMVFELDPSAEALTVVDTQVGNTHIDEEGHSVTNYTTNGTYEYEWKAEYITVNVGDMSIDDFKAAII